MNDYRHVVVHVGDSARTNELLACAARLAAAQGASVHAVYAVAPLPLGHYLSAETATAAAALKLEVERKRIQKAHERVLEASRESGRPIEFEPPGGDPLEVMTARSRLADLVLVGQPSHTDADAPPRSFVSRLLVAAGCPVLLVPEVGRHDPCGSRVLVAWSGTRESARALRDALPILQRAAAVEVLRFGDVAPRAEDPLAGVAAYLRGHGVAATCAVEPMRALSFGERMLTPTVVDTSIAELLLSHAADMDADLLVMGAYGHARAFELVLGGVTRTLLGSMPIPVLMSH